MISGKVTENDSEELEAWLTISVEHANEGLRQCEVIVDTGFTGWLMLPESVIKELGLVSVGNQPGVLASGAVEMFDYYVTRAVWHGQPRWVVVLGSIDQSLLGMELLRDNRITMDAWAGGNVTIEEAPAK